MSTAAIAPVASIVASDVIQPTPQTPSQGTDFSNLLSGGLQKVSDDVLKAEALSQQFALSDAIPVHQVTYALEQARLSVSMMVQVRNRLLEGYQQLMNMQL